MTIEEVGMVKVVVFVKVVVVFVKVVVVFVKVVAVMLMVLVVGLVAGLVLALVMPVVVIVYHPQLKLDYCEKNRILQNLGLEKWHWLLQLCNFLMQSVQCQHHQKWGSIHH